MFIFLRLLLSHFIADFPLQVSKVYELKLKKAWGSFVHSGIVVLVCIVMNIPFLHRPQIWVVILWIWLIHGLQDWLKVTYCEKVKKDNLWIFMLDQMLHIALISVVFLIPKLNFISIPHENSLLLRIYNNDTLVIYLMGYIFACFGGIFINLYMKEAFLKIPFEEIPNGRVKWLAILERALIMTSVLACGYWLLLIPLVWVVKILMTKKREKIFYVDLVINTIIAVVVGGIVWFVLH